MRRRQRRQRGQRGQRGQGGQAGQGLLAVVLSIALLAAMFAAVHRGARGRERAAMIQRLDEQRLALESQRTELSRRIEHLGSRARVVRAAAALGLRLPGEGELVVLEVSAGEAQ